MSPPNTGLWRCSGAECQHRWKPLRRFDNKMLDLSLLFGTTGKKKKKISWIYPFLSPPLHSAQSLFCHFLWTYAWIHGNSVQCYSVKTTGWDNFRRPWLWEGENHARRSSEERTCGRHLSEATLTRAVDLARINLTPFLHRATLRARDELDAQVARSPRICLGASLSPVLALFPASLSRQILFLWVTPNHLEHQSVKPSPTFPPFFFFFFPQKTGEGSRLVLKLACTGMHWHTGKRLQWLTGCQVIEDCQSNFKRPLSPFSALI